MNNYIIFVSYLDGQHLTTLTLDFDTTQIELLTQIQAFLDKFIFITQFNLLVKDVELPILPCYDTLNQLVGDSEVLCIEIYLNNAYEQQLQNWFDSLENIESINLIDEQKQEIIELKEKGQKLKSQGQYYEAIFEFCNVLNFKKNDLETINALGFCLQKLNQIKQALLCFQVVITLKNYFNNLNQNNEDQKSVAKSALKQYQKKQKSCLESTYDLLYQKIMINNIHNYILEEQQIDDNEEPEIQYEQNQNY